VTHLAAARDLSVCRDTQLEKRWSRQVQAFLIPTLEGGERSASRTRPLNQEPGCMIFLKMQKSLLVQESKTSVHELIAKALYYKCNLKLEDRTLDISEHIYPFHEFPNYVQFIEY